MAVKIRSAVKSNVAFVCGTGRTKSIYGDNLKVVVAEAPATTKRATAFNLKSEAPAFRLGECHAMYKAIYKPPVNLRRSTC